MTERTRRAATRASVSTRRPPTARGLTHVGADGRARMVDVGAKPPSAREAVARGAITISAEARRLVRRGELRKGDPLEVARLAGIMAAKRAAEWIPLCHPISLSFVDVRIRPTSSGFAIEAVARTTGPTGVEMEALTAVAAAALTLYDMVKAVDRGMVIGPVGLVSKRGGRSGTWTPAATPRSSRSKPAHRRRKPSA